MTRDAPSRLDRPRWRAPLWLIAAATFVIHPVLFWSASWTLFALGMEGREGGTLGDLAMAICLVLGFPIVGFVWVTDMFGSDLDELIVGSIANSALWSASIAFIVRRRRRAADARAARGRA